jgi:hypothetical protein
MPQALPAKPNLDWLKKTAKQRLVQLRISQSDAKLRQALLAVAHDYGFKSWRALKSHVGHHATALGWAEFFGRDDMAEPIREKGGVQ